MSLLFAERPLVINTQLAMKIGLNEAIVLQQLHYWLRDTNSGMECDGVRWIYNTTEQWLEQFPFWSESTLKRAFASLKTLGLLRCEKLNKSKRDMTNFYTINYGSELLDGGKLNESIGSKCAAPSGQNDTMEEVKMKRSIGSKRLNVIGSKWPDDLTENTTEITTENKNTFRPEASQQDPQTTEQDFLTRNSDAVVFSAKKRQWGSREDLACAQWIWGGSWVSTNRQPVMMARSCDQKSLTGLPGPMTCAQCGCWMAEATDKFAKCLVGFSEIHSG